MTEYIWLRVTNDEYELPVAVGRSAEELARICGVTTSAIFKALKRKGGTFRRVKIDVPV